MTIESLGRRGGPKPGEHGVAAGRHSRPRQPETRAVPAARPKPAPPRSPLGEELRRAAQAANGTEQARAGSAPAESPVAEGQPGSSSSRERGPAPRRGGRAEGKTEGQSRGGERSLYDGGSPSANRLGPAKAMRARDVSRPRE
ncbi:MAG: hypothetical protein ACJ786_11805 [Catenulispora sp.]